MRRPSSDDLPSEISLIGHDSSLESCYLSLFISFSGLSNNLKCLSLFVFFSLPLKVGN